MDMLYFDDMPLDWQLTLLNNSQNGENDVDISLLNQISNNSQNAKELLELKMSDNQLEHFLSTMDQPLVNHYNYEQVHTTQNINTMETDSISPLINQQFIDTNALNNSHLMQDINNIHDISNTSISLTPVKAEKDIPVSFTANEQYKNIDNQQLIQELINNKLQSIQRQVNNNINDVDYSSLIYNQELLNHFSNNDVVNLNTVGTKRKEAMPDLNTVHNTLNKKLKKVAVTVPSHTQNYTVSSTGVTQAKTSSNLHSSAMNFLSNSYSNDLQPTASTGITQEQLLLHYLNNVKNKELSAVSTIDANNISSVIDTLTANTTQDINSVIATPESLNSQSIPSTTSSAVDIQNTFIPNVSTQINNETDNNIQSTVTSSQYVSPKMVNSMNALPNQRTNDRKGHPQNIKKPVGQQIPMTSTMSKTSSTPAMIKGTKIADATIKNSATVNKKSTTINKKVKEEKSKEKTDKTLLKKVKMEEPSKNEILLSKSNTQDSSSSSTKVSTSFSTPLTSNPTNNVKYPLNTKVNASTTSTNASTSSSSNNPKLNSMSWVKTQENNEVKMAISRLKSNELTTPVVPLQVIKHQKKVAHNAIERRYRNNINDRIKQLQDVIPALQYTKNIKEKEKNQKENKKGGGDDDVVKIDETLIIDGIPAARKLNKATVLKSATDYIVHLKKTSTSLKEENKRLMEFIKKVGGEAMLNQFTKENGDLYEEKKPSTTTTTPSSKKKSSSSSSQSKEKGKRKEKGKQQSLPVQEASPPHIYSSDSPSPTQVNSPTSVSSISNEDEGTMLDILSGERENSRNNVNDFNSNSTFTTLMVSLSLFSVGLLEYGSYLTNSDSMTQYENYEVGRQGKVLIARSEDPLVISSGQPSSFYQYLKSKLVRMEENLFICSVFYLFIISLVIMIGKRIFDYNKKSRNKCISSIATYSLIEKIIIFNKSINELVAFGISKVNRRLFDRLFHLKNYSYPKLILSHCRMIERDILITKNKSQQYLIAVFYTTLQILNNIKFVTNEISYSTCSYILYTTAIQFYMNFKNIPFGKSIALSIWRKGNYFVSKIDEDKEEYEKSLNQSKKYDDYKRKRKINIDNEAIDSILKYINENPERCEKFFIKGRWIAFFDRNTIEMSNSFYDFSNQKCLLITFSTAYKYNILLNTFKEHGLKYIYMAPSVFAKSGESTEVETNSELENNGSLDDFPKDKKQIKEDFKNNYLSLSSHYFTNNYLISSLEAPINKIMSKLITDKTSKKKEKELSKMMKVDYILGTIVKVANSSLIVNDINLYWYAQILWIMVSWKKEYFKPIISENTMDKINVQLFYADQFRKLIISSVTSYYSDVVQDENEEEEEEDDDHINKEEKLKPSYSEELYSYSVEEEEEEEEEEESELDDDDDDDDNENENEEEDNDGDDHEDENDKENINNSEYEYVSKLKTETQPTTTNTLTSSYYHKESEYKTKFKKEANQELGQAYQSIAKHYFIPNYSTVHFISDSTRQFITLSLFTWLMVQKKKFNIAKRSTEKAYQILDKITNISLHNDEFSFTSLFEEENDYYPDIVLKFERIVTILAGTWLVEAEKIILNEEHQKGLSSIKEMNTAAVLKENSPSSSLSSSSSSSILEKSSPKNQQQPLVLSDIKKETIQDHHDENEINSADDVISLPKITINSEESTTSTDIMISMDNSMVPKISEYFSVYLQRYVKLLHYYQEMLPFIGSDIIAMECFKTIQRYQNDIKAYCL
jgi:hypothetical protein